MRRDRICPRVTDTGSHRETGCLGEPSAPPMTHLCRPEGRSATQANQPPKHENGWGDVGRGKYSIEVAHDSTPSNNPVSIHRSVIPSRGDGPGHDPGTPQHALQRPRPQRHPVLLCLRAAAHRRPRTVQERVNARVLSPLGRQDTPDSCRQSAIQIAEADGRVEELWASLRLDEELPAKVSQIATAPATRELLDAASHSRPTKPPRRRSTST
jgi:hypothetical protein